MVNRAYSPKELQGLEYEYVGINQSNGSLKFKIKNKGQIPIASKSAINNPIRVSWRIVDVNGNPTSGWDARKDLPYDSPAHGEINVFIPIEQKMVIHGGKIQISLVQEGIVWLHDIGVVPLEVSLE